MDMLHHGAGRPDVPARRKTHYFKLLSLLGAEQEKMHAEQQHQPSGAPGQMGGVQAPEDSGLPPGIAAMPGYQFQQGQQADANPILAAFRPRIAAQAQNPVLAALAARFG